MDSKELRGLYEAYSEVYVPQEEIGEGLRTTIGNKIKKHTNQYAYQQGIHNNPGWLKKPEKRAALNKAVRDDIKKNPKAAAKYVGQQIKKKVTGKNPKTGITGTVESLDMDIFDMVLEFLQVEGFAETLEEAQWLMANVIDNEEIDIILEASCEDDEDEMKKGKKSKKSEEDEEDDELDEEFELDEAEGSYGATPKAYSAARKTKMTAKRKPFLKKMLSRTNPANRTSPYDSPRKGLTADDRERARAGSKYGVGTRQDHDYPSEGPGGVTKNPKKLRKQKAMGEHD